MACLRAFCRVAETGSFSKAGQSLGISGSAISKLVSQLESDLQCALLTRTTRSVAMTELGAMFYQSTIGLIGDLERSIDAVRGGVNFIGGVLRVSAPSSFGVTWLGPRLPAFMKAHPELELQVELDDRKVNLVESGFDCAIRISSSLPDSTLVVRRLGVAQRVMVAAPAYLRDAPPLEEPGDLNQHECLIYSLANRPNEWPLTDGQGAPAPVAVRGRYRFNSSLLLRDAVAHGLGVALSPLFVMRDLVASGQAVEVLAARRPAPHNVYGVVAHHRHLSGKISAFFNFVANALSEDSFEAG